MSLPNNFTYQIYWSDLLVFIMVGKFTGTFLMYQAFMETAWRFPGRRHNLGTSLGGAVVDQCHLGTQQPQLRT